MGKNDDIRKSFFRFAAVLTALAALFLMLKTDNVFRWVQAGITLRGQQRQIEQYESEIAQLERKIDALSSNRDSLEKYARETFFFCESGDDVYIVEEEEEEEK